MKSLKTLLLSLALVLATVVSPMEAYAGQIPIFGGTVNLTAAQLSDYNLTIQGNIGTGATLIWPSNLSGQWNITNSANATIQIQYSAQATPLPISPTATQLVYGNGTGLFAAAGGGNAGITALIGDVTASGTGAVTSVLNNVGNVTQGILPLVNGGNSYNAIVTAAPYNASGFVAQTLTTSTSAVGATTISVKSSLGFNPGQMVFVYQGGTSNVKMFAGIISSAGNGTITLANTAVTIPSTMTLTASTATSGTTGLGNSVGSGNLVWSVGSTQLTASAASGDTSITVTNAASYNVGQGILVYGGKTSNGNLVTQISGITGNTITFSPSISNASGVAAGAWIQHDDSVAFQKVAKLVSVTQSIKALVPDGYYQINVLDPACTSTTSIICVPPLTYYSSGTSGWNPQATLEFTGNVAAPQEQSYLATVRQPHLSGAILQTNLAGGSGTSIIAGFSNSSLLSFTNVQLFVKNLAFRAYPNPNINGIQSGAIESLKIQGLDFDDGSVGAVAVPTNNVTAILFPGGSNGGNHTGNNIQVMGWYNGIYAAEHVNIQDIRLDNDACAMVVGASQSVYGVSGREIEFNNATHGICLNNTSVTSPSTSFHLYLDSLNIEHGTTIDDINDPNNLLTGYINLDTQGVGFTFNVVGGAFINVFQPNNAGTLAGTNGVTPTGKVFYQQPQINGSTKTFTANFVGYENNSSTNQTISFFAPFVTAPAKVVDSCATAGLTVTITSNSLLTITAPNSTTAYSCYIKIDGV